MTLAAFLLRNKSTIAHDAAAWRLLTAPGSRGKGGTARGHRIPGWGGRYPPARTRPSARGGADPPARTRNHGDTRALSRSSHLSVSFKITAKQIAIERVSPARGARGDAARSLARYACSLARYASASSRRGLAPPSPRRRHRRGRTRVVVDVVFAAKSSAACSH